MLVSPDGGRTFGVRAQAGPDDSTIGDLGSIGYAYAVAAVSERVAYVDLYRAGLLKTLDGGIHWRRLHGTPFGDTSEVVSVSTLADGAQVWQAQLFGGLYASRDGGHTWRRSCPTPARSGRCPPPAGGLQPP